MRQRETGEPAHAHLLYSTRSLSLSAASAARVAPLIRRAALVGGCWLAVGVRVGGMAVGVRVRRGGVGDFGRAVMVGWAGRGVAVRIGARVRVRVGDGPGAVARRVGVACGRRVGEGLAFLGAGVGVARGACELHICSKVKTGGGLPALHAQPSTSPGFTR